MNVCIIPARGGSKRIPKKNIKVFCEKPMIAWSIETALASKCFDKVIVSTDDEEIKKIALFYGAEVPFKRPPELSNDTTGTIPVIKHAILELSQIGPTPLNVCCLYATAPFTQISDLQKGYSNLIDLKANYAFSVTSFPFPIQRAIKIVNNKIEMFHPEHFSTRSQDLEEAYHDAGQFYWGTAKAWLEEKIIFGPGAVPVILERHRVQDIDTPEDWKRAEWLFKAMNAQAQT